MKKNESKKQIREAIAACLDKKAEKRNDSGDGKGIECLHGLFLDL